jgi:transcription elongation factor Elf1
VALDKGREVSLQQTIEAIKSGDKERGRQELLRILAADATNVTAWLWLSACYDEAEKRRECLEEALRADPTNEVARRGLEYLKSKETSQSTSASTLHAETIMIEACLRTGFTEEETKPGHSLQTENLAWTCPDCNSRNMTPIVSRTRTTLRCQQCAREYECVSGEAVWGQCDVDGDIWSQWLYWIVRLIQVDGSVVELGFTLHTRDFTIASGDFLVVLMKQTWTGKSKVVQIDNKTTEHFIRPGKS